MSPKFVQEVMNMALECLRGYVPVDGLLSLPIMADTACATVNRSLHGSHITEVVSTNLTKEDSQHATRAPQIHDIPCMGIQGPGRGAASQPTQGVASTTSGVKYTAEGIMERIAGPSMTAVAMANNIRDHTTSETRPLATKLGKRRAQMDEDVSVMPDGKRIRLDHSVEDTAMISGHVVDAAPAASDVLANFELSSTSSDDDAGHQNSPESLTNTLRRSPRQADPRLVGLSEFAM
ncbi:hypothetical protein OBBRIDRAFT_836429 [Obba rivulosa]|uniref:Uncharacterized protein n=1 Tax=Obba rivulosa TaxID=1052685 RepID=A0A8E2DHV5_9APHY|nr:hypothetical protein OBBRIDRAFT_836429 [Obba rivulosa]